MPLMLRQATTWGGTRMESSSSSMCTHTTLSAVSSDATGSISRATEWNTFFFFLSQSVSDHGIILVTQQLTGSDVFDNVKISQDTKILCSCNKQTNINKAMCFCPCLLCEEKETDMYVCFLSAVWYLWCRFYICTVQFPCLLKKTL